MSLKATHLIDSALLFEPLKKHRTIVVAVSGGSDSMALLTLLHAWQATLPDGPEIIAVTVNHRLREEATDEISFVKTYCDTLDIEHITLEWHGLKPDTGISAKARKARYQLLGNLAAKRQAGALLLGHTLDDQAETMLMRLERVNHGSPDWRGLSGISKTAYHRLHGEYSFEFLRPLLELRRNHLRAYLRSKSIRWIDDPTNENENFERVRVRKRLSSHADHYPTAAQFGRLANVASTMRGIIAQQAAAALDEFAVFETCGLLKFEPDNTITEPVLKLALRTLIAVAGGQNYFVPDGGLSKILQTDQHTGISRHTLGSSIIEIDRCGPVSQYRLLREDRNLDCKALALGSVTLWDGRLWLRVDEGYHDDLSIGPLGKSGVESLQKQHDFHISEKLRQLLISQPAIFENDRQTIRLVPGLLFAQTSEGSLSMGLLRWGSMTPALERFSPLADRPLVTAVRKLRENLHCPDEIRQISLKMNWQ